MNWLKDNMACVGRVLGAVLLGLSVITAVFALDGRWVKQGELQAMEQKVVKNLDDFQKAQDAKNKVQRYQTLSDQMMTQKQLIRKYPEDKVKEEMEKK
jgi:ribulose kinase